MPENGLLVSYTICEFGEVLVTLTCDSPLMTVVPVETVSELSGVASVVLERLTVLVPTPRLMDCPSWLELVMLTELLPLPVTMFRFPLEIEPSILVVPGRNEIVPESEELFRMTV